MHIPFLSSCTSFDVDFAFLFNLRSSTTGESSLLRFLLGLLMVTGLSRGLPLLEDCRLELGVVFGLFFFLPPEKALKHYVFT